MGRVFVVITMIAMLVAVIILCAVVMRISGIMGVVGIRAMVVPMIIAALRTPGQREEAKREQ